MFQGLSSSFPPYYSCEIFGPNFYFTNIADDIYWASNPVKQINVSYNPHLRPWYLNHMLNLASQPEFSISEIYQDFVINTYSYTITKSLRDSNSFLQGILALDTDTSFLTQFTEINNLTIIITDEFGTVLVSNVNNKFTQSMSTTSNISIVTPNVTGFNQEDWINFKGFAAGLSYHSNCPSIGQYFCRINSLYDQEVIIDVALFQKKFYLIVITQLEGLQALEQKQWALRDEVVDEIQRYALSTSLISVLLFLISSLCLTNIFSPLNNLKQSVIQQITLKDSFKFKLRSQYVKADKVGTLLNSYMRLKDSLQRMSKHISIECKIMNYFRYPLSNMIYKFDQSQCQELRDRYRYSSSLVMFKGTMLKPPKQSKIGMRERLQYVMKTMRIRRMNSQTHFT